MGMGDWLRRLFHAPSPSDPEPFAPPTPRPPTTPARLPDVSPADAERADRAVEVLLRHPEADEGELPSLLAGCGMTPAEG